MKKTFVLDTNVLIHNPRALESFEDNTVVIPLGVIEELDTFKKYEDERGRLISNYDLGQATYAMMVAAADLGIGTGHSSVGEQELARGILGVPDDHDVAYLLGVGYPADRPLRPIAKPNRRPISEVIRHGHW